MSSGPPPPAKPIGPGNHDKAWNDPPLFSVEANTRSAGNTKPKLTARVGFSFNCPPTSPPQAAPNTLTMRQGPPMQMPLNLSRDVGETLSTPLMNVAIPPTGEGDGSATTETDKTNGACSAVGPTIFIPQ